MQRPARVPPQRGDGGRAPQRFIEEVLKRLEEVGSGAQKTDSHSLDAFVSSGVPLPAADAQLLASRSDSSLRMGTSR